MIIPKIQFRHNGIMDIIWWTRPADVFCKHFKHWKEMDNYPKACAKHGSWLKPHTTEEANT